MTEQEAIYCLKAVSERYPQVCEECQLYGQTGCDHCYDDANDVAIKALEKQIPKKCNIRDRIVFREGEYEPIKIKSYRCPICNHETGTCGVVPNYCMSCGHKLESRCEDDI